MDESQIGAFCLVGLVGLVIGYVGGWVARGRGLTDEMFLAREEALEVIRAIEDRGDLEIYLCGRKTKFADMIGGDDASHRGAFEGRR